MQHQRYGLFLAIPLPIVSYETHHDLSYCLKSNITYIEFRGYTDDVMRDIVLSKLFYLVYSGFLCVFLMEPFISTHSVNAMR